jgi:hypothetical protein
MRGYKGCKRKQMHGIASILREQRKLLSTI